MKAEANDYIEQIFSFAKIINKDASKCCVFSYTVNEFDKQIHQFAMCLKIYTLNPSLTANINAYSSTFSKIADILKDFSVLIQDFTQRNWFEKVVKEYSEDLTRPIMNIYEIRKRFKEEIDKSLIKLEKKFKIKIDPEQDDISQCYDYCQLFKLTNDISVDPSDLPFKEKALSFIFSNNLFLTKKQRVNTEKFLSNLQKVKSDIFIKNDNEIIILETTGTGAFGVVYKGIFKKTAEIVAVKEMRIARDGYLVNIFNSFCTEILAMDKVRSIHSAKLVGAHISYPFRILTRYYSGGSLFDRLHSGNSTPLTSTELTKIAYQVASGMDCLHKNNFVHRDLKTLNILLDSYNNAKISDFGLCRRIKSDDVINRKVGTPQYMAPEIFAGLNYERKVDVYSYAIVLWEMLRKKLPFENKNREQIYEYVVTCNWRLELNKECPKGLKKLITRCWSKNPDERPTFEEIVKMFRNNQIYFPDSERIDWDSVENEHHCPLLSADYLLTVLRNPNDEYFNSVTNFIINHKDDNLIELLSKEKIIFNLSKSKTNIPSILLLASEFLLSDEEFSQFLDSGGMQMFISALEMQKKDSYVAALSFATKISNQLLTTRSLDYLPQIIDLLGDHDQTPNKYILQFIDKFGDNLLQNHLEKISNALPTVLSTDVDDQRTFDSISHLTLLCQHILSNFDVTKLRVFAEFISPNYYINQNYIDCIFNLIGNSIDIQPILVINILQAIPLNLNLSDKYQKFLLKIDQNNKQDHIFEKVLKDNTILNILSNYLRKDKPQIITSSLFLLFCLSKLDISPKIISQHEVLQSLLEMNGYIASRLQILVALTDSSEFCLNTKYMDGIIHILASSFSGEQTVLNAAVRLMFSMSFHSIGCKILSENGIFDMFVQMFVSSSLIDTNSSYTILRNAMKFQIEIPQIPLIASCLLHSLLYEYTLKEKILDTLVALVKKNPGCVQVRDLQIYILKLTMQDVPLIVLQSFRLLAAVDDAKLAQIPKDLLAAINQVLCDENYQHPKIIKAAIMILNSLRKHVDLSSFIQATELLPYLNRVCEMLPKDDKRAVEIQKFIQINTKRLNLQMKGNI